MKKIDTEITVDYTFTPRTSSVLRKLLQEHRVRLSELSTALNIPYITIYNLLNKPGTHAKTSTLLPIANFFKVTIGQLIGAESLEDNKNTTVADEPQHATGTNTDLMRYELEMVTYILGRISHHDAQNTICPPSITWVLTYKVKQLIQLLIERKDCCWLDLLEHVTCRVPAPLHQLLVQFGIH